MRPFGGWEQAKAINFASAAPSKMRGLAEAGEYLRTSTASKHKLIEPDMFEAETPLGYLRRPAPCVEFSETKGYWADPVLRYRGSDKPEWRS